MRPARWALRALLLVRCAPAPGKGPVDTDVAPDVAGDGFSPPEDCNDVSTRVHPVAAEICDGADNDCDSLTDDEDDDVLPDGAPTWYPDGDADGSSGVHGLVAVVRLPP
ncbi:MAG: putative metal-binding motif-containing protein [Alphaproteobacteria bacterium]|nr:putative metal-binding motif-containing protein [Alphaproteobacteria bacterium]